MCSSVIIRPVDHAHCSWVVKFGHAVVALRESQQDCYNPYQGNHNLCRGGGEAGLQRVDDGHVPWRRQQGLDIHICPLHRNLMFNSQQHKKTDWLHRGSSLYRNLRHKWFKVKQYFLYEKIRVFSLCMSDKDGIQNAIKERSDCWEPSLSCKIGAEM